MRHTDRMRAESLQHFCDAEKACLQVGRQPKQLRMSLRQ